MSFTLEYPWKLRTVSSGYKFISQTVLDQKRHCIVQEGSHLRVSIVCESDRSAAQGKSSMEVKKMLDVPLCGYMYLVNAFSTTRQLLDLHVLRSAAMVRQLASR